jgi:hypothetical protein
MIQFRHQEKFGSGTAPNFFSVNERPPATLWIERHGSS